MLAKLLDMKLTYILLFLTNLKIAFSCLCMPSHPQEQLCHNNTFVALVKVRAEEYVYADDDNTASPEDDIQKLDFIKNKVISKNVNSKKVTFRPRPKKRDIVVDNLTQLPYDEYITSRVRYRVKVYEAYKGVDKDQLQGKTVFLYTAPDEGLCGRKLHEKKTYIVIGRVNEEQQLTVGLCDHVIEWDEIDIKQKRNVRRNMRNSDMACRSKCEVQMCRWSDCRDMKKSACMWSTQMEDKTRKMGLDPTNYLCMPASKYGGKENMCVWSQMVTDKKRRRRRRRRHHEFGANRKQVNSP